MGSLGSTGQLSLGVSCNCTQTVAGAPEDGARHPKWLIRCQRSTLTVGWQVSWEAGPVPAGDSPWGLASPFRTGRAREQRSTRIPKDSGDARSFLVTWPRLSFRPYAMNPEESSLGVRNSRRVQRRRIFAHLRLSPQGFGLPGRCLLPLWSS